MVHAYLMSQERRQKSPKRTNAGGIRHFVSTAFSPETGFQVFIAFIYVELSPRLRQSESEMTDKRVIVLLLFLLLLPLAHANRQFTTHLHLRCTHGGLCDTHWPGGVLPSHETRLAAATALRREADRLSAATSDSMNMLPATLFSGTANASVILNIGSSIYPLVPLPDSNSVVLAFEPVLEAARHAISKHHPNHVLVVGAAVGSELMAGLQLLTLYSWNGEASSLRKAAATSNWNDGSNSETDGVSRIVPTLTLRMVLNYIPPFIDITLMKTDMQGVDFDMLQSLALGGGRGTCTGTGGGGSSGGDVQDNDSDIPGDRAGDCGSGDGVAMIRRIKFIISETWMRGRSTFASSHNDLCRDWLPLMTETLGYRLIGLAPVYTEGWSAPVPDNKELQRIIDDPEEYCRNTPHEEWGRGGVKKTPAEGPKQEEEQQRQGGAWNKDTAAAEYSEADAMWVRDDVPLTREQRPPLDSGHAVDGGHEWLGPWTTIDDGTLLGDASGVWKRLRGTASWEDTSNEEATKGGKT